MTPNADLVFRQALDSLPLVAILRGLHPSQAVAVGQALWRSGWKMLEVPLNSPDPLHSIALLARALPLALVGAGTVLTRQHVQDVHQAGGRLIVSPHLDAAVVNEALKLGLVCLPGVLTPTEAFAALQLGASGLKLFPAEACSPAVLKALRAVLPPAAVVLPVGGIQPEHLARWRQAGANGLGIGSAVYRPGQSAQEVEGQAKVWAQAWGATDTAAAGPA
jgi:2-dehydro-3-deoxyphosphogalactonate aldolase